jgi:hypothetical protein
LFGFESHIPQANRGLHNRREWTMPEFRDRWGAYARLQEKLARRGRVDDRTWGLEAGLNRLLAAGLPAEEDLHRTIRSESRKERHRTKLRRTYLTDEASTGMLEHVVAARRRLRGIESRFPANDWILLRAVGEGHTYEEIARIAKVSPGALRARVLRLRRTLVA